METAIVKINPADYGLEESKAKLVEAAFKPMIDKMVALEEEFNRVIALPVSPEACNQARELRLEYVRVRTGTAKIHKEAKAFYLAGGRFIDGWKNAQLFASQGIEDKLKAIEYHYENIAMEQIAKLQKERLEAIAPFDPGFFPENLGEMEEEVWKNYFNGIKLAYEERKKAEQKAEKERIAKEKAEAAERQRIREENERLKKEAEERYRVAEIEKKKREKAEATRKREEEKEKKVLREKIEAERKERERLEKEKQDREAEEKARIKAEATAKKKAEMAPDVDKLKGLADRIVGTIFPICESEEANQVVKVANMKLREVSNWIIIESKKL